MFRGPFLICQTTINPNQPNNKKSQQQGILVIITPIGIVIILLI
jgi:hypothetical protein